MAQQRYLVALGSSARHHRFGRPAAVLAAALGAMYKAGITVVRTAPVISSRPIGPALRTYANGAVLVETALMPDALLAALKRIERQFGRRGGQRWGSRVIDLDIVLWSGGPYASAALTIPHREFRKRRFVLDPAAAIVPAWRDPLSGRTIRQLAYAAAAPSPLVRM